MPTSFKHYFLMSVCLFTVFCGIMTCAGSTGPDMQVAIPSLHGSISDVKIEGGQIVINCVWNREFAGKVWIGFLQEGALYSSVVIPADKTRTQQISIPMPSNLPAGRVTVECVPINQPTSRNAVGYFNVPDGVAVKDAKPSAWGIYKDHDGIVHPWEVSKCNMMLWDGEFSIPFGGMINTHCSWATNAGDIDNPGEAGGRLEYLENHFKLLKKYGLEDIYYNGFFPKANPNTLNKVVALSEKYGMKYGLHVSALPSFSVKGFIRDEKNFLDVPIDSQSSKISVSLNVEDHSPPHRCIWYLLSDSNEISEVGIGVFVPGDVKTSGGDAKQQKLSLELTVSYKPQNTKRKLLYMPELPIEKRDPVGYAGYLNDYTRFLKQVYGSLETGPGLRFWSDPFENEMHASPLSLSTDGIYQQRFAGWLLQKYGDVNSLNTNWSISEGHQIKNFETAAKLVPIHEVNSIGSWLDPDNAVVYKTQGDRSDSFRDVREFRGMICEEAISRVSDVLKEIADVPVILKHNCWISDWFCNPKKSGGQDGVGYEAYCYGDSLVYHNSLVAYAEATASARNQLLVVTESAAAAFEGQKDYIGYMDRLQMLHDIDQLMYMGAKGFYHFGFDFSGNNVFYTTELVRDVRQLEWLATHAKIYRAAAARLNNYTPTIYGWYPARLSEREIIGKGPRLFEMDGHYMGAPTQIRQSPDGNWIVPALNTRGPWKKLLVDMDLLTKSQLENITKNDNLDKVFLSSRPETPAIGSSFKVMPLNGFTCTGIGVIKRTPAPMTLDLFRKEILGYQVFQTDGINGQTLPEGGLMVWACAERDGVKLYLPSKATAASLDGNDLKFISDAHGQYLSLIKPPYKTETANLPNYLIGGYYLPDHGQPEVAVVKNVTVEELIALNPPAFHRWLPKTVRPEQVAVWKEAEDFEDTTFTQPRIEGYSRYSNGCAIGINSHYGTPKGEKFATQYKFELKQGGDLKFWLRRMDVPAMDVEIWIDGKAVAFAEAGTVMSDTYPLTPWNAGIGKDNLRTGWLNVPIGVLKQGEHSLEIVAADKKSQDFELDTALMGADAEKHEGVKMDGRAMRCMQVDAWMITFGQ